MLCYVNVVSKFRYGIVQGVVQTISCRDTIQSLKRRHTWQWITRYGKAFDTRCELLWMWQNRFATLYPSLQYYLSHVWYSCRSLLLLQLSREYALRRRTLQSAVLKKQQMYGASASEKKYLSSVVSVQSQWAAERARAAALLLERDLSISTWAPMKSIWRGLPPGPQKILLYVWVYLR